MADNTLGKAYVQIVPSSKGISGSISNVLNGEAGNAGRSMGEKIVSFAKTAIIAGGIGKAITAAIKEGARYEQARGGIETLFGAKGAKSIQEYANIVGKSVDQCEGEYKRLKGVEDWMMKQANNAWKTAGISANDYMEQSTSFAASLLQSLGGNQVKAAKAANQAVIDMSDNANKFGTNIADIQHAYQGFAKQNYTMLDNLKLGYGGTKTEMERLLKDAEEISGIHYDIDNLSDVYSAIHVIQKELEVTGTTAKEASTTLSGSFASMKAAASNFMAQLVMNEDVKGAMNGLVESTVTFAKNLIPAVGRIFAALPGAIGTAIKAIHPELLKGLKSATDAVKKNLPGMIENAMTGLMNFSKIIRKNSGEVIDAGLNLIKALAQGIIKNIPTFIKTVPTIISNFAGVINDNGPKIIKVGLTIIKDLAIGLIKAVPVLIKELPKILKAIWDVFTAFQWVKLGKTIMTMLKSGITAMGGALKSAGQGIVDGIKTIFANGWNGIKATASMIWEGIKSMLTANWNAIKSMASTVWNAIKSSIILPIEALKVALNAAWNLIKTAASTAWNAIKATATTVWNAIKTAITNPIDAAKNTVRSIINTIKGFFPLSIGSAWSNIVAKFKEPLESAKSTITGIINKIKGFFPLKLGKLVNFSLPSISIGTTTKKIAGKSISVPSFSVSWHAKGGVFDDPSVIGVGEAGREIVTPEKLMRQIVSESNEPVRETLVDILTVVEFIANNDMTLEYNKREFGRMVREVQYG